MTIRFHPVGLLIVPFVVCAATASADWPQFRGPGGQGRSEVAGLPLSWSETENVAWKVPVEGRGWSSPVILGNEIWMTTALSTPATDDEAKKKAAGLPFPASNWDMARSVIAKAVCVDLGTGRLLRSVTLFEFAEVLQISRVNSFASPTPVIEPGRLYCDFGTMGTVCLGTNTGRLVWKRRLPVEHQEGPGSSPILHGDLLVLVRDGCDEQYVTALDKTTGKTVWKTDRPPIETDYIPFKKSFSTPLVVGRDGSKQMIAMGAKWIVSYAPDSGKPIWYVDTGSTFSNSSRPVFGHGMVFAPTAYGGSYLLAIRTDGRGDVTDTHVSWRGTKQVPKKTSPLLVGDELYTVSDKGVATCLDARSGQTRWTKRIGGSCSASPVFADGRIYFFDEDGQTTVVRPGKRFAKLAENNIDGPVMASAAIADKAFFIRTGTHLYRIEEK